MHQYNQLLVGLLQQQANPERAAGAKAYMRYQFEFLGIPTPLRRQISKDLMKNGLPPYKDMELIVKELWEMPQREYQYVAVELLAAFKKQWNKNSIKLFKHLIIHKSWWDTVDHIGSLLIGPYFKLFPEQVNKITRDWNRSENIWLQRSSIMFQKSYQKDTNTDLLSVYILNLAGSKEFFIQKAIGWALREYSKTNPVWVKHFVATNQLPALSYREALKRIMV